MRILAPELAEALSGVYAAVDRPAPLDAPCYHLYSYSSNLAPDNLKRILEARYQELTWDDLFPILHHAYRSWGTWSDLAYFIPRLLELGFVFRQREWGN